MKDSGTAPSEPLSIDLSISYFSVNVLFDRQCSVNVIFHESPVFGIDLGTTYSCIAYQEREQRRTKMIVADVDRAEYCIPTAIYFPPKASQVIIGEDALKKLAVDPMNVIFDIKRIVGRNCNDGDDIESFSKTHSFNISCTDSSDNIRIFVPNLNDYIVPEQVCLLLLTNQSEFKFFLCC